MHADLGQSLRLRQHRCCWLVMGERYPYTLALAQRALDLGVAAGGAGGGAGRRGTGRAGRIRLVGVVSLDGAERFRTLRWGRF